MDNREDTPSAGELGEMLSSLYNDFAAYLVELAQMNGCSPDHAEDLVQDTFTIAMEKIVELYHSKNRRGWLVLTLKNRMGTVRRSMQYAQRLLQNLEQLHRSDHKDELKPEALYSGLVSEEDLRLLVDFCVKGLSVRMLAARLGISEAACRKRIERAKERFRQAYDKNISQLQ